MAMVSLVVMEPGSRWPGDTWNPGNVVAIGPAPDGLVRRTRQELDSLRRHGQRVGVAVLACNGASDLASTVRRAELVDELLTAVAAVASGHLVLAAADDVSTQLRREMLSLAEASSQKLRGRSITVSVKFGV
jgi:hypothetical protein